MERTKLKHKTYLKMAKDISQLSKDENTKNGAIIVGKDGTPVSWGYNGTVAGFRDDIIPHSRETKTIHYHEGNHLPVLKTIEINKYPFMCHAEANALDFGDNDKIKGSTIYVTGMPCVDCAMDIAKKKIATVMIPKPKKSEKGSMMGRDDDLSKFIFAEAGIRLYVNLLPISLKRYVIPKVP
jgi:dCMP deaminase